MKNRPLDLVLKKYANKKISLGRAAELAKLSVSDFMMKAKEANIAINYTTEQLENDFKAALRAR